jgi:hypothetical protein
MRGIRTNDLCFMMHGSQPIVPTLGDMRYGPYATFIYDYIYYNFSYDIQVIYSSKKCYRFKKLL